jgi:hypothetical protein
LARRPPVCLAGALHGREKQTNQRRDDRDHHEEFDERKTAAA